MKLSTPVSDFSRVGKATAKLLARLGIKTARDLLYWFPFRYEDFRHMAPIKELRAGENVTVRGQLELIASRRSFKSRKIVTEALLSDDTGSVRVVWFNQPYIAKTLKAGDTVFLSGKVTADMLGTQLVSPTYEKAARVLGAGKGTTHTARLVPIYPLTEGLTQKQLRFLTSQALVCARELGEWVPAEVMEKFDLPPLAEALRGIHFPADDKNLRASTERLKFDELFLVQLRAEKARAERAEKRAPALAFKEKEIKEFVAGLPFVLTRTQKISAWEILQDLGRNSPMNRLLSGDVGSGKTVVAAMALYNAALNGFQGVLLAPTEILARQHFDLAVKLLAGKGVKMGLYTRSEQLVNDGDNKVAFAKNEFIKYLANGEIQIAIGTHALLSEKVGFKRLGLVVVDEQHCFGVAQRKTIKGKGEGAHFLSMTATPIPRSLALMIYGDLDVSVMSELPPGRKKILTRLVDMAKRDRAYAFIRDQVRLGRQVFVICPLIEEKMDKELASGAFALYSPLTEKKSVMSEYEKLSKKIFPDLRVGYLHGKMDASEKESALARFKNRELDILVSTSVIEVGVDIPNASVMMIEGADRFGLAQLHQFRGRVGRAAHQSYCILFTNSDSARALERLKFFETHHDGFKLAEKDLAMRGPGEVYGTEQSGMMQLRLAKLTDREIIKKAREAARLVAKRSESYPRLREKIRGWEETVHLE